MKDINYLKNLIQNIVKDSYLLVKKYVVQIESMPVNYACIFCQSEREFHELSELTQKIGTIIKETKTGPIFKINKIKTIAGDLDILKIRVPDKTRPERGDADFTISHFSAFKDKYLDQKGFSLIEREDFEMIELIDPDYDVRAYFSKPPINKLLKNKK